MDVTEQRQVPARMKANGNFSDASLEWLHFVLVIMWWAWVTLLTWSRSWCMCSCFSGISRAALWCNRLHFSNFMCTMLLSNVRPSQTLTLWEPVYDIFVLGFRP